jgi:hypothetical protein
MTRYARSFPSDHRRYVTAHGTLATAKHVPWSAPGLRGAAGEAVAMSLGESCAARAAAAVAALVLAVGSPANPAFAYGATGDRLFPATLVLPQIAPGDEFYVWADTLPQTPSGEGTGTRQSNFSAVYAKTITDRLGIVVEETWTRLDRVAKGSWSAMQNLDTEIKYLAIDDQPHEFLLTLGLDREWGGTGATRVGAFSSGATTPRVYFGKGLGDLDATYLRPLAIAGFLGYRFADSPPRPDLVTTGFVVEYSIPYLQSKVQSFDLPAPIRGMTPMTEVSFSIPSGRSFGARTTALIAPGVNFAGEGWEFIVEALVPATRATAGGAGVRAQLHLSLDFLFPDTIGRPLLSAR